jgi:hypothetical protein
MHAGSGGPGICGLMPPRSAMGTYAVLTPARAVGFASAAPSGTCQAQLVPTASDLERWPKPGRARASESGSFTLA